MKVCGVDVGGTFTDLVLHDTEGGDVLVHKVRSTPDDPGAALIRGLLELCRAADVAPAEVGVISHGTTVATNAVLEDRGAVTGMLTTRGFRDVAHIGRHQRPQHYSIMQDIPWQARPFVARRHRWVVSERVGSRGEVLEPLDEQQVRTAARAFKEAGVESVAVCFLFSFRNPTHELRAAEILAEELPEAFITTSAGVVPQFGEFERFTTALMNAFVGPGAGRYLGSLAERLHDAGIDAELRIMTSNGGVVGPAVASKQPVTLILSGPAAGVLGGVSAARRVGRRRLITFDVGGTSADIAIVTESGIPSASARDTRIAGFPTLVPMLDVHTIGAGGGSLARVDSGGAFRVGPQAAEAVPGPACYGLGGICPTVTDANVVLGRIDPQRFLGGDMPLDREAAVTAVEHVADALGVGVLEAAEGIVSIVNANMAQAIRSLMAQRGYEPREFSLVAFGGGGALHAAEVAGALDVPEVIVPQTPGITSAMGLLTSDVRYDRIQTVFTLAHGADVDELEALFLSVEGELTDRLQADGVPVQQRRLARAFDCRYVGQGYELRVDVPSGRTVELADVERFHELYELEYGYRFDDSIEIVNLRVTAFGSRSEQSELRVDPPRSTTLEPVYEGRCVFRVDDALTTMSTSFYDRASLPLGGDVVGPAVLFQPDTTILVPPRWTARPSADGALVLTAAPTKETHERFGDPVDPGD